MALSVSDDAKITEDTSQFLRETCWVVSCCCFGTGCSGCVPFVKGRNKCCCLQSSSSSEEDFCGPMGCIMDASKCLCCLSHSQFPPEQFRLGLCNIFCLGSAPSTPADRDSLDLSAFSEAFWCYYCCCEGLGLTGKVMNPMISGQSKLCCCFSKHFTTDCCGPRGCISINQKTFCCAMYKQCPPTLTPGIGCCNMMICGDSRETYARNAPVQQRM
mmetsp:Transcript_20000/g.43477  ORF Transcript_20000/g.43477 Transcript_20000/m.43477 type:complete len:215 (-) Transcript_20000:197-841(-)